MPSTNEQAVLPAVHRLGHVGLCLTWNAPDWACLQSPVTGDGISLLSP